MLSRMMSDIDALDGLYLMLLVPTVVAVLAVPVGWVLVAVTPDLAWLALGSLVLAGIGVPVVAERLAEVLERANRRDGPAESGCRGFGSGRRGSGGA